MEINSCQNQSNGNRNEHVHNNQLTEGVYAQERLINAFEQADNLLMKKYIPNLLDYNIVPIEARLKDTSVSSFTRLFKIDRIVYDKKENNQDKLLNVYNSLYGCNGSVVIIMDSDGKNVDFYIGTKAINGSVSSCQSVLSKAIKGNFPGTRIQSLKNPEIEKVVNQVFETEFESFKKSISAVTGIASFREEKDQKNIGFVQGMEKIIDSMRGEKFSIIIVADPITQIKIDTVRSGYEALYSQFMPFSSTELTFSQTDSQAVTDSLTQSMSNSISEILSSTHTYSKGNSKTESKSKESKMKRFCPILGGVSTTEGMTESWNESESEGKSAGKTDTSSEQKGTANTYTNGHGKNLQIKLENKSVNVLLEKIDTQIERLNECNDLGMWNCSTYVVADDMQTSKVLASTYQALMRGADSGVENSAVTTWMEMDKLSLVTDYLKKLHHPLIDIGNAQPLVSPTSLISGNELTIAAGLPQRSIPGVPVYDFTSFGREIVSHKEKDVSSVNIGKIYHMGNDDDLDVLLNCNSLTAHTFITGSTGSGKSNAVYKILNELNGKNIPFLVIEPTKGEYKHVFGNREDVLVFGTNQNKTPMLKINPFKFPNDIHVLEHIDRLIEIFNVCWPMYAAMPAVLKEAIEGAYQFAGWDLDTSKNCYEDKLYPCFVDVLEQLHKVIDESDFSQEVKSNYIGALVTRVKSLTNGINGQVFVANEIDDEKLFNRNTIIDLSRVASMETKAMLMGILVMRLQEFRISEGGMNKPLRHITVLEEAHNLLKRTSSEQASEGANLLGKSVEMLANSIAEMRTFGEGFIIADQSPNMLDLSVIRNTNTKIILRLPALEDRELVGRAACLNDDQIIELAKLSTGIAVVYQNDWLDPVLCHIDQIYTEECEYKFGDIKLKNEENKLKSAVIRCLLANIIGDRVEYCMDDMRYRIIKSNFSTDSKLSIMKALAKNEVKDISEVSKVIANLFALKSLYLPEVRDLSIIEWNERLIEITGLKGLQLDLQYQNVVLQCLIREKCIEDKSMSGLYEKWTEYMRGNF